MSQHVAKLEDGTENHLKTGGEQITYANKATAGSVDPRCKEVFTQLKIRRKHRYIVYKIDPETEAVVVETIGARDADLDALLRALPDADSRYAIFDHAYKTYDGRPANKLFFLSWFPSNATPVQQNGLHAREGTCARLTRASSTSWRGRRTRPGRSSRARPSPRATVSLMTTPGKPTRRGCHSTSRAGSSAAP